MSELYSASETAEAASEAGEATGRETSSGRRSADRSVSYPDARRDDDLEGYSDAGIEATLAAEERLPESRTRQDAAADTWDGDTGDLDENELGTEYDGDVEALLVSEEAMPESRTRYDAAADTWDDAADPDADDPGSFSGEPASEYDGDVEALFARDEAQPESRTRQEAATATWSDADSGQDARPDTSTDGTSSSQPGTVTESVARNDDREGDQPHPYARQVAVQTQAGTEVPITVEYVPPEARTVGDTTPTGIGRKPTGEEFLDMEGDEPAESGLDRLFRKATEEARDVRDAFGGTSETIHDFNLRGPAAGDGHAHEVQPVREPTPPGAPAFSDLVGSAALVGVAVFTGIRYGMRQLGKGDVQ